MDESFTSLTGIRDQLTSVRIDGGSIYFSAKLKKSSNPPFQLLGLELVGSKNEQERYLIKHDLVSGLNLVVDSYFDHGKITQPKQMLIEQVIAQNEGLLDSISPRFRPTVQRLAKTGRGVTSRSSEAIIFPSASGDAGVVRRNSKVRRNLAR